MRKVIDTHTHVFPDSVAQRASDNIGKYYSINMQCDGKIETLLSVAPNISYFVVSSAATNPLHVQKGNDFILNAAKEHSNFIPFCSVHPEAEGMVDELRRIKALGARGIKIHPDFQHFDIDDERMFPLYEEMARLSLPVLFHVGDENTDASSPSRLLRVIERVESLTAIAAHMGGYCAWDEAVETLYGKNVYFDTSDALISLPRDKVLELLRRHPIELILFGSDFPLASPSDAFELFDSLPLTEEQKNMIYFENAARLLGIV